MIGTAQEVADWYEGVTGYTFHPTVIGQLYARRRLKPDMVDGKKIYSGMTILTELDRLRQLREQGIAYRYTTGFSEANSETAVRPSMSSAQGIDSNGVADGNRTRDTRSHNSEPNQGNTTV